MKTISKLLSILFVSLFIISCSGDDDSSTVPTPTAPANDNFIRCKIDGVSYEVTGNKITGAQNTIAWDFRSDVTGGGTGLDFSVLGQATVGTYSFNMSNVTTVGRLNYRLSGDIYSSGICNTSSGTLTITSKTGKTIMGTFSFTGKKLLGCANEAKAITDGSFKMTFL